MERILSVLQSGSGPRVATVFYRLLALVFLDAWVSIGFQVRVLIGSRGLLPIASFLEVAKRRGEPSFWDFPTIFWLNASDRTLVGLCLVGVAVAIVALLGIRPRLWFAVSTLLYLSVTTACRTFLSFQWDNMLLECGVLVLWLPGNRPAPGAHWLFRLLLFKLYWESGIAKWQSHLHDWQDGSAMTFYYETAPLPTWLGWYAHAMPSWWHHLESWGAVGFELVVPFFMFGPRLLRRVAFVVLSGFQAMDAATANYGFFCYLSGCLHIFLLDDGDLKTIAGAVRARLPQRVQTFLPRGRAEPEGIPVARSPASLRVAFGAFASWYLALSTIEALGTFANVSFVDNRLVSLQAVFAPWRLVNTYHLFGHITRERIEPEFQTLTDSVWTPHHLWHKPGAEDRAPDFVAPHQPRVDFNLWFYGLSFRSGAPPYVGSLVEYLCRDPEAVQSLFRDRLPPSPQAVRIALWQYHFTTPSERATTGAWWRREGLGAVGPVPCESIRNGAP